MKPIIRVENLSKRYQLGGDQKPYSTLRESLIETARKPLKMLKRGGATKQKSSFWALKDINFEVQPGEVVGIIGRNGAGKSTLLKVLSRITEPTRGRVELFGRVGSLLEVGTGFHPELTGRENIFLNGAILGMQRSEIARKFDEIVAFAEVEKFLDTPVKHYSSGMYTRLAFAVAANLEPEVLIVDEVLAVGDAEFQRKCLGKMKDVSRHGRTVIFVSHSMGSIRQLCERGIYMANGELIYSGEINDTINKYLSNSTAESAAYVNYEPDTAKDLEFERISLHKADSRENYTFEQNESITINFDINIRKLPLGASLFTMVLNQEKVPVCAFESETVEERMTLKVEPGFLVRGRYSLHTFLHVPRLQQFDVVYDQISFEVDDHTSKFVYHGSYNYGSVFGRGNGFGAERFTLFVAAANVFDNTNKMSDLFNPVDYPICLETPLWMQETAWAEHVPFAMYLMSVMRPRTFVELGSFRGVSYCAFCQSAKESNTNTECYAVDTWQGDSQAGFLEDDVLSKLKSHHDPLYGDFSHLVQSTFDDALTKFEDKSIDLLHIDGFHTYEAVSHDFKTWLPKMSERGVVLFHDTNVRDRDFGVWKFWEEAAKQYPHFEFLHGHGLGVLAVGAEILPNVDFLFKADAAQTDLIRSLFQGLGARVELTRSQKVNDSRIRELEKYETFVTGSRPVRMYYHIKEKGFNGYLKFRKELKAG